MPVLTGHIYPRVLWFGGRSGRNGDLILLPREDGQFFLAEQ